MSNRIEIGARVAQLNLPAIRVADNKVREALIGHGELFGSYLALTEVAKRLKKPELKATTRSVIKDSSDELDDRRKVFKVVGKR